MVVVSSGSPDTALPTVEYSGICAGRGAQLGQLGQQLLTQRFDLSRVRGVVHRDGPDLDTVAFAVGDELARLRRRRR